MDVKCATCGEPWDTYHLRHDEVYETEAGLEMIHAKLDREDFEAKKIPKSFIREYKGEKWEGKLTPFWEKQFAALGWKFGGSLYAVIKCACCKDNEVLPDAEERILARETVADLLEDDEDGIAVTISDLE